MVYGTEWHKWLDSIVDIIDGLAVDFYSQPKTGGAAKTKSFAEGIKLCVAAAKSINKPWCVMETGTQEKPGDPNYKPQWYAGVKTALAANPRCLAVFFNVSNDGPGGWMPDTSPQSLSAYKALVNDKTVWR
jgi:CO/xanthine dehydrogenase Mo-binding subunit